LQTENITENRSKSTIENSVCSFFFFWVFFYICLVIELECTSFGGCWFYWTLIPENGSLVEKEVGYLTKSWGNRCHVDEFYRVLYDSSSSSYCRACCSL